MFHFFLARTPYGELLGPIPTLLSPGANCIMLYVPVVGELSEKFFRQPHRLV